MESRKRSNDSDNPETPRKEQKRSRGSGSRQTRSQAAPDWSKMDSLILVNEIAAVEADCKEALSSYQKWKIIADNCTALDVSRNSNQCHRQWDMLFAEYNMIKQWEAQSMSDSSYWSLGNERRKELGIPEDFDSELFDAIDNLVRAQEDRLDTDPDTDPEAELELVDVIAEPGSKKQRRRWMHPISNEEQEEEKNVEEEEENKVGEEDTRLEEMEGRMAAKLRENAELIHAILKGKLRDDMDCKLSELKNIEASRLDFTRQQGDKLIACFGDIVKTLNQLCDICARM